MLIIRKYANGRFYDTVHQRPVTKDQLAQLIRNRRKIKVIFTQTGEDITRKVISQLAPVAGAKKETVLFVGQIKKWIGAQMDRGTQQFLGLINLPSKDQVARLTADMEKIAQKIDELQRIQARAGARRQKAPGQQSAAGQVQDCEPRAEEIETPSSGPLPEESAGASNAMP
jgi:polyhydroxyalkanoate synthesis regulator protein